jgi:hypothetical protein
VLFQHDQLVVQPSTARTDAVVEVVTRAAADATRLLFRPHRCRSQ